MIKTYQIILDFQEQACPGRYQGQNPWRNRPLYCKKLFLAIFEGKFQNNKRNTLGYRLKFEKQRNMFSSKYQIKFEFLKRFFPGNRSHLQIIFFYIYIQANLSAFNIHIKFVCFFFCKCAVIQRPSFHVIISFMVL